MGKFKFITGPFKFLIIPFIMAFLLISSKVKKDLYVEVYETSAQGNSLKKITEFSVSENRVTVTINPKERFETITGFGDAFTESSAHLLYRLSAANRKKIMETYFSEAVNRYATYIIGGLNNWVDGWVDWNMVLDKQGNPNWFKNWCTAPVIVDPEKDEVYFTPLYYTMALFSKFIRRGAVKIGCTINHKEFLAIAVKSRMGVLQ